MKKTDLELDQDLKDILSEADSQALRLELLLIQILRLLKEIKIK